MISDYRHIVVFLGLGALTFVLRASFLVFWGKRDLPDWAIRHLRYTAVAIIPGMIAPLLVFPKSMGGVPDVIWLISAFAAIIVGIFTRSALLIMIAGALSFILLTAMRWYGILF